MKAIYAYNKTGIMSLGDDSAVFIDGLDGFPGVHSRRWSGKPEDDRGRNEKILKFMEGEVSRTVHLTSRFSLVDHNGEIFKTSVTNYFDLATEIHDSYGFGYDGLLIPRENAIVSAYKEGRLSSNSLLRLLGKNLCIGEMTQDEKNAINNRGRIARWIGNQLKANTLASYEDLTGGIYG